MATKPTVSTEWATQDVANGNNSTNNKVESTASHKAFGITFPEPPGRNHLNYWMNAGDQWFTYFTEQDTGAGVLNTNYNINAATSNYSTRTIVIGAGTVNTGKTDIAQTFIQSTETTIVVAISSVVYIGVNVSDGVIDDHLSDLYLAGNEIIPLYKVTTDGSAITQVIDLRTAITGTVVNGGYVEYDPQTIGSIQGGYTGPTVHNNSDPGFFLGRYSGAGTSALQGFAVTNSATDYVEYSQAVLEVGSGVNVSITPSATNKALEIDCSSYDWDLFTNLGDGHLQLKNTVNSKVCGITFSGKNASSVTKEAAMFFSADGSNIGTAADAGLNLQFNDFIDLPINTYITDPTNQYGVANKRYVDKVMPVGAIIEWGLSTPPSGFLELDGSAISRTTYSDLFAVVGTVWGVGNGTTTFNIRDDRGEFKRGWDNSRGVDSGRALNSTQSGAIESHAHDLYRSDGGGDTNNVPTYPSVGVTGENTGSQAFVSGLIDSTGGSETRPRNVATMYCVRY